MESGVAHRYSDYLETYVQVGLASGRVVSVSFTTEPDGETATEGDVDSLDAVFDYLSGGPTPDVGYALTVAGVERRALESTRRIPRGETTSYAEYARSLGAEDEVDDVRGALDSNPVPIVLPCHRVVPEGYEAGGDVGTYAGPTEVKRRLLALER
ncbi:MAG: methylated-DNA--[protein]-cysteine S-methyltransferase [Halobacteriales archaeon]